MKKIVILIAGILFLATTALAFGMSATGSAKLNNDNLMSDFDDLVKEEIKNDCICTREFAPVCGKLKNGEEKTFSNKCGANCAGAEILYKGGCKKENSTIAKKDICPLNMINPIPCEKEGGKLIAGKKDKNGCVLEWKCVKKNYNTGITGGIDGVNNKVPAPEIKVDLKEDIEKEPKNWRGDNKVFLEKGLEIVSDNGKKMDKKLSLEFDGKKIKIDDNLLLQEKDGDILLEGKKIFSEDILKVREKAKKVVGAEKVLEIKFEQENDKPIYVIKTEKKTKFLGLFNFDMEAEVKIDVETEEVLEVDEPWYSFLLF